LIASVTVSTGPASTARAGAGARLLASTALSGGKISIASAKAVTAESKRRFRRRAPFAAQQRSWAQQASPGAPPPTLSVRVPGAADAAAAVGRFRSVKYHAPARKRNVNAMKYER
jgi:hypothetical protein